jgi:hypothetical protein
MDDKTLDNIFKTAFNTKSKISREEGDWDAFEVMLKQRSKNKNFFSFQWNRFNIYYVGILLAGLISGSIVYCQNYLWNTNAPHNEHLHLLPNDTSAIQSGISEEKNPLPVEEFKDRDIHNGKQNQSISKNSSSSSIVIEKDSVVISAPPAITKDTTSPSTIVTTPPVITPSVVVMKRKKTVVLTTPQDTVIKIDTVKIKKGRKK